MRAKIIKIKEKKKFKKELKHRGILCILVKRRGLLIFYNKQWLTQHPVVGKKVTKI